MKKRWGIPEGTLHPKKYLGDEMIAGIREEIQKYSKAVEEKSIQCDVEFCLRCGGKPDEFSLHDRRKRTLLFLVDRLVQKTICLLPRWKCPRCGKTFTLYPLFMLPFKRYVIETVFERSERYLEEDPTSYRKAVRENGLSVFYESASEGKIDERQLAHSTLYRWLTFFSGLKETLAEALRIMKSKSPGSGIFRTIFPIPSWKYRSEERREALQTCLRLILAESDFQKIFSFSIFPRLATSCRWS
jgi:hypothetical protein